MLTISKIISMKKDKKKISMVTAYDYPSAKIAQDSGVDMILVGDSISNTLFGNKDTLPVEMDTMILHTKTVKLAAENTFVIGDMPFMSYQISEEAAIKNACKFMKYGMADAVKLEGGLQVAELVKKLVDFGIPVMGHIGFTPQSHKMIGIKSKGKYEEESIKLMEEAKALQEAGAFSIVLEMVTEEVSRKITETLMIPTIGIGSGVYCDGQVLVWHDLIGLNPDFTPKFAKKYIDSYSLIKGALSDFVSDVKNEKFPEEKHSFKKNN